MRELRLVKTLYGHREPAWSVSWSARGLLATCSADRTIRVYHEQDGAWPLVTELSGTTFLRTVRSLAWSADGRTLAAASFDGTATVLELLAGKTPKLDPVVCLEGHDSEVKAVAYSSSGALLATCSRDRSVWVWEVGLDFEYDCIAVLNGHSGDVKSVSWHAQIEMLVSCSYDDTIRVWVEDDDDWFCCETLAAHSGTVWATAFENPGNGLASVSSDGSLVIWRRVDPPPSVAGAVPKFMVAARVEALHDGEAVYSVDWKGPYIVTGGADDCIKLLEKVEKEDEKAGKVAAEGSNDEPVSTRLSEEWVVIADVPRAHTGDVNCVSWNPAKEGMLASCGDDGLVRIWQVAEREEENGSGEATQGATA